MSLTHINKADLREGSLNPGFREKSSTAVSGKRTNHNISFHRNGYQPEEEIIIDIPRLSVDDILVQDSLNFCFNIDMNSNTKSWFKNNLAKMLQEKLEVNMEGQKIYENPKESLYEVYKDLWASEEIRQNSQQYGIANENTRKLISKSDDGASSGNAQKVSDKLIADLSDKQKISLNKVLSGNGPFSPFGLNNELQYKIRLPSSDKLLDVQSSQTKAAYRLKNCELEYQTIKSKELASGVQAGYKSGVKLDFDDVCHVKSIHILTTDTKLSETVNFPKVSPKYILILFRNASEVDNEKYENPGVKSIRLDYEGDSNVIYQNGLKEPELYNEARRVFGKGELSTITKADFYKDKFAIVLDLRTHEDNQIVGSGVSNTISRTQSGFTIHMELKTGRSNKLTADIFLVSHGQAQIQDNSLQRIFV